MDLATASKNGTSASPVPIGECAKWIVDELIRRGCKVNSSGRLGTYARRFAANDYAGPFGDNDQSRMLECLIATRDVLEITHILEHLPDLSNEELQNLCQDAPEPKQLAHSPGRDRQHELSIAANCNAGGMPAAIDQEPDIWCKVGKIHLAIAAKRVRSANKVLENIKTAAKQIQASPLHFGVACIDTSLGWNPDHIAVFTSRPDREMGTELVQRVKRLFSPLESDAAVVCAEYPKLLGLALVDVTHTHSDAQGWSVNRCTVFYPSRQVERSNGRILNEFIKGWTRGSPNNWTVGSGDLAAKWRSPGDRLMPLRTNV